MIPSPGKHQQQIQSHLEKEDVFRFHLENILKQMAPQELDKVLSMDVTKTGNGEWGMGNGEWGMGNGKLKNGKLKNGEWEI